MKEKIAIGLAVCLLCGCSGMTQIQDSVSKLDQGAHSVSTGEMAYLHQVQAADCANEFYNMAYKFSIQESNYLDLSGTCAPTLITDDQMAIRQALMDAITLYADKIQAMAAAGDDKTLGTNGQTLATNLNGVGKLAGFTNLKDAQIIESAIVGIAQMALDQKKFDDIKKAAKAMSGQLKIVVSALEAENSGYSIALGSKISQIEPQLHLAALASRNQRGPASFLDVIAARDIERSINPLGASPVASTAQSSSPTIDPGNIAKQLNAALDALVSANDALASAGNGGVIAAVSDLVARGQSVNAMVAALGK